MPTEICASRGPRIGSNDELPRCKQPINHSGWHRPDPEDGWGNLIWGNPLMPDLQLRKKFLANGWEPTVFA